MRKLVFSIHLSLDGFVGGPNGEINWIKVDEELFDFTKTLTDQADTAFYGRVTYQIMERYWPTAADKPAATKHDKEHSQWYNNVPKIVLSKSLQQTDLKNTIIVSDNILKNITAFKQEQGKNILMFGSPSAAQALMHHNLIDEYWLFVNPLILGHGIPLFTNLKDSIQLKFLTPIGFSSGVIGLHYIKEFVH
jgi:dihydrofolate reductase